MAVINQFFAKVSGKSTLKSEGYKSPPCTFAPGNTRDFAITILHKQESGPDPTRFIALTREAGGLVLKLKGPWTISHVTTLETSLTDIRKRLGNTPITATADGITRIDTAGAWILRKYLIDDGIDVHVTDTQRALLDFLPDKSPVPLDEPGNPIRAFFINIGRYTDDILSFLYGIVAFVGQVFITLGANILSPRKFRFPSIIRHIYETGIQALPIVGLLAFLMSMVIFYQGAIQLQKFGADIFTIDLTVISLLREMGVLITAIMVAGRSGSAFAAEIGVMKLREEVDALKTMGMDPIEVLVAPRIVALVLTLPILAFFAVIIGLAGGAAMASALLDIPLTQYIQRVDKVATTTMFFVGMIKAPVFGFLIAIIGTYNGLSVSGSAESVGRLTTISVVQSIFLVILADAIFSIIFAQMGI